MGRVVDAGFTFFDAEGAPAAAGTVSFFTNGTTTFKNTYATENLEVANANPLTLNAAGRLPVAVFGSGAYTMLVKDADGATILTANDVVPAEQTVRTATDGDTTPSVAGVKLLVTNNTAATLISDFDGGRAGQVLKVLVADVYTIFDFTSSGLKRAVDEDMVGQANQIYTFTYDGTDWYCEPPIAWRNRETFIQNNDFQAYAAANWDITTTEAGAGSATEAAGDARHGELVITNAAGLNDKDLLQFINEVFKLDVAGKISQFRTRIKSNDVDTTRIHVGLAVNHASNWTNDRVTFVVSPSDGTAGDVYLRTTKDGTDTKSSALATLVDDTYIDLWWWHNGVDSFYIFVNGAFVEAFADTNLPDDEELAITLYVENLEASANSLTVDYYYGELER